MKAFVSLLLFMTVFSFWWARQEDRGGAGLGTNGFVPFVLGLCLILIDLVVLVLYALYSLLFL